ncbi:hypothetical protein DFQ28_003920, partial [Apophysomyces sp. BC1034]
MASSTTKWPIKGGTPTTTNMANTQPTKAPSKISFRSYSQAMKGPAVSLFTTSKFSPLTPEPSSSPSSSSSLNAPAPSLLGSPRRVWCHTSKKFSVLFDITTTQVTPSQFYKAAHEAYPAG